MLGYVVEVQTPCSCLGEGAGIEGEGDGQQPLQYIIPQLDGMGSSMRLLECDWEWVGTRLGNGNAVL